MYFQNIFKERETVEIHPSKCLSYLPDTSSSDIFRMTWQLCVRLAVIIKSFSRPLLMRYLHTFAQSVST